MIRLPDEVTELKLEVPQLAKLWKLDLDGLDKTDTFMDNESNLIKNGFELPFPVDATVLQRMTSTFDPTTGWKVPPDGWTEAGATTFLNEIVDDLAKVTGRTIQRSWSAEYCNHILSGSPIKRKPDIVLLDVNHETPISWRNVRAITEVTRSKSESESNRMVDCDTVNDKTFVIFTTQFPRTFVPIISIFDGRFHLTVTDRQGQIRSITYSFEYQ